MFDSGYQRRFDIGIELNLRRRMIETRKGDIPVGIREIIDSNGSRWRLVVSAVSPGGVAWE
jgi:hypothetical protein